jgi:uncharacterized protein YbbK (DUF523 family)
VTAVAAGCSEVAGGFAKVPAVVSEVVSPPNAALAGPGRVLVSACLAGWACRYDGSSNRADWIARLLATGRAVLACPEVDGGLGTPRPPAEIVGGSGDDVLDGRARVVTRDGRDVTEAYVRGAQHALATATRARARVAVLKARSPSCGRDRVYDGTFTRTLADGEGVTAALLRRHGLTVLTEEDLAGL